MCDESTIPLSVFALDFDPPVTGWGPLFEAEGVEMVEDAIGRPAISCEDAARLIGARRAARAFAEAERARREAEMATVPVPRGIPAVEGLTATEQMFALGARDRRKSVTEDLLDRELAHLRGVR